MPARSAPRRKEVPDPAVVAGRVGVGRPPPAGQDRSLIPAAPDPPSTMADADPQALGEALDAFLAGARAGLPDTLDALAELRREPVTGDEHGLIEAMKIARGADTASVIEPADASLLEDLRIWANFTPGPRVAAEAAPAREAPSPAPR